MTRSALGRRVGEEIDVVELMAGGGMVEHHGESDRLQRAPGAAR